MSIFSQTNCSGKASISQAGSKPEIAGVVDSDKVIFSDLARYSFNNQGLSVLMGSATELADTTSVFEFPAALIFNFILEGCVDFSVVKHRYRLEKYGSNAGGSAIILAEPETLVRYSKKGSVSKKISVLAQRDWLESRAKSQEEKDYLSRLFTQHGAFRHWQPSDAIIHLAQQLFQVSSQGIFSQKLVKEALTIQLLSQCMDEMEQLSQLSEPVAQHTSCRFSQNTELKEHVDEMLKKCASLEEIADSLGCSTSTLQRKFKSNYGITVIHYCRHCRLDMAKRALTIEGASIGEAAFIAGYNHPSNFVSAFKKRFYLTPTELVRMNDS